MFQLVSSTLSTCRKKERDKRKQFPLVGKSLSTWTKSFPDKLIFTSFGEGFLLQKNKRKLFLQDTEPVSTIRNKKFVEKYVSARQKIPFTGRIIWKIEKISFYEPKNQFSQAEIKVLLKRLLPPNLKIFNKALNQARLFLLDRKFVSTSRNQESVKKNISLGRCSLFSMPGTSDKWKKRFFTSQKKSFYWSNDVLL